MSPPSLLQTSLVLHMAVETMATYTYFFRPSATFSRPQPVAHGVLRQYALLLLCTNIIVAMVLNRSAHDKLSAQITAAVALYHVGPFVRAVARIRRGDKGDLLASPWLHAVVHLLCGACMVASSFSLW
ncbi:hypothetical protein IMSHALPRED_001588 [Imshaugia aleurites]|uniref:Uncharacterized protein n=1 Tax=Imshaugia aleurites TaxID=172621 RepID=A0A8H3PG83_9LECA|nr:hypothetical protein IMSHALPRED_001588 [Imshaugia aleurites]